MREAARPSLPWAANPGPQALAFLSEADELYFGGAAGGGKTDLLKGLALTRHRDSLILRRRAVDAKAISKSLKGHRYGAWKYAGSGGELRTPDGRTVEVGGCEHDDDKEKYQGQPHDLIGFDELPQFTESQYTFIIGWNRSSNPRLYPNQRCRVVGAGNPPTDPEGEWVLRRWRAWLDPAVGQLAPPGSLKWYTTIAGEDVECPDARPVAHKGMTYLPRSRTFIPARLEDNPDLMRTGYAATLEAMPEPLRSILRYGDMLAGRQDDRWQLIPTKWVLAANRRWADRGGPTASLSALGVDVAMSTTDGGDATVIAPRFGLTIGELTKRPGRETPEGQDVVNLMLQVGAVSSGGHVNNIDAIGIGKSAYNCAQMLGVQRLNPVIASGSTDWRDPKITHLKFANVRAAMYWNVRVLLDPEGGEEHTRLALPPDPHLLTDLTAPRYMLRVSGVAVESKDDIRKRIGRSTDAGDAVALACWTEGITDPGCYGGPPAGTTPFDGLPAGTFESSGRRAGEW
jgi:hypothetical protein